MANRPNGTLYRGVTSDLVRRTCEHRKGAAEGVTRRYAAQAGIFQRFGLQDLVVPALLTGALALPLAGCEGLAGGSEVTSAVTTAFPPKPDDCPIVVFRSGEPGGAYQVVARLMARIEGPPAPGGDVNSVLPELKQRACRLGADAIVDLGVQRNPKQQLAMVSGTAIRFAPPAVR